MMIRHTFSPIGDSPYCAYVRGVGDDAVCGETEYHPIHLSDDIENDRFVPFASEEDSDDWHNTQQAAYGEDLT